MSDIGSKIAVHRDRTSRFGKVNAVMKVSILVCLIICISSIGCTKRLEHSGVSTTEEKTLELKDSGKCWFHSSEQSEATDYWTIRERQNRETYGYPEDLPISDALRIFNEEQRCSPNFGPDLTEDEILSALAVSFDYTSRENWSHQIGIFRKILKTRTLPKGSLLVNEGCCIYQSPMEDNRGEIRVKGQRIYLFLLLNENPRMSNLLEKHQIFLIKKTFYGLEGI